MKKLFFLTLFFATLFAKIDTEAYSRWLLNKGDLLVDKGKYLEAIEAYDSSIETTNNKKIKIDATLRRVNVLLLYLDQKKEAKENLYKIYKNYPTSKEAEYALYNIAMIEKDLNTTKAKLLFKEYTKKYPNGKYLFQAKYFIKYLKEPIKPTPTIQKLIKTPYIRVLLKKNIKIVNLKGNLEIDNTKTKNATFYFKNGYIIYNSNKYKTLLIKSNKPIFIKEKNNSYYGNIKLVAKKRGIYLINIVDITHYLYGVITSESYSKWNIEALKAQAVASRTYAYYQTLVRKHWLYDVRDNTFDQVYNGIKGITKKSKLATNLTKGQILTYNNKPILAQYMANAGWYVSSSKEIFNTNLPYLYSHKDDFSIKATYGKWQKKVKIEIIEKNLQKLGIKVEGIKEILPYEVTKSGRVVKVKIIANNGNVILRTYNSIRRAAKLKDILLKKIERKDGYFHFYGGGFGHGVGYSQWGGAVMAKNGYNYKEILNFYYYNCKLIKKW